MSEAPVEETEVAKEEATEGFCADFQIVVRNGRISFNNSFTNRRLTHAEVVALLETIRDGLLLEGLNAVPKERLREVVNLQALATVATATYAEPAKTEETPVEE